jgi:very-short-patch-repair endonuclease
MTLLYDILKVIGPIMLLGLVVLGLVARRLYVVQRYQQSKRTTQQQQVPASLPKPAAQSSPNLPYKRIPTILTVAEQDFFRVLSQALPDDMLVFPQVRLAGLVHPTKQRQKQRKYDFYRIQAKTVDYVLCDATSTAPRLVVELDDSTHSQPDRQARDAFVDLVCASVGLPILHVRWSKHYDTVQLRQQMHALLGIIPSASPTLIPPPVDQPTTPPFHGISQNVPHYASVENIATLQREPPHAAEKPVRFVQQTVDTPTHGARIACGNCRAAVSSTAKYCNACGAVLA